MSIDASYSEPYLIAMPKIGTEEIGYISVASYKADNIPFEVKRTYWTYWTPDSILRGRHAHRKTEQLLFALSGSIVVTLESARGKLDVFKLDNPNTGLYLPPNVWRTMQYGQQSVQLALASTEYDEKDYIRSYPEFLKVWQE